MNRQKICRGILRAIKWHRVGEVPKTGILIGAPHTSNWDFAITLLVMWGEAVSAIILIKKSLFWGPLGWFLRKVGGVPVDRGNAAGLVRSLIERLSTGGPSVLLIAPEGKRRKDKYWKSGFYHIARSTQLPISMGFIDGPTRAVGFGPTLVPSGDVVADMDAIRAFYVDKRGLRPAWKTEPRLREERR